MDGDKETEEEMRFCVKLAEKDAKIEENLFYNSLFGESVKNMINRHCLEKVGISNGLIFFDKNRYRPA